MALIGAMLAACATDAAGPGAHAPTVYHTVHFRIVDSVGAPQAVVDSLRTVLEVDYGLVGAFLPEFTAPDSITVLIRPGPGIPFVAAQTRTIHQWLTDSTLAFDYLPHQLTHVWTGYQRRPFFEEGLAVYATTQLVPLARMPDPYRRMPPHEWVSLFVANGSEISLFTAYGAQNLSSSLSGSSPDASTWQLYVEAGSFTQWVFDTYGRSAWMRLYTLDNFFSALDAETPDLETRWFKLVRDTYPNPGTCEDALAPVHAREAYWCRRAQGL